MKRELAKHEIVERSIVTTYRKQIWVPFINAVKKYELIKSNDKIAVCISGGKDSMLMAKLLQQLHNFTEVSFELVFIVMDPGYNTQNRQKIEENAKLLNIPITVFETDIFSIVDKTEKSPCYLCARMRRGHLYSKAKELGCNKIALGHHFSDVIETTLMGMLYGGQIQAMLPKLHSTNFEGMELIRPMYCIEEKYIINWCKYNELKFIACACRFTESTAKSSDGIGKSKRQETKMLIKELKKTNPNVEKSIFNSIHNVNLDTLIAYKSKGEEHVFLDDY